MNAYPSSSKALLFGIIIAALGLTAWEMHWRSAGYPIAPEDDKHLWAAERAKLEKLDSEAVVLIGSSRVWFDFQLDEFEEAASVRPVMLAAAGTTPIPVLTDIVEHSKFAGTMIVGITPPLYFSPLSNDTDMSRRISNWVKHYHKRTYADRLNHQLSKIPQNCFAFLNSTEEEFYDELDIRTILSNAPLPPRVPGIPPFPCFQYIDGERNVTMLPKTVEDTSFARMITNVWSFFIQPPPDMPPPEQIEEMKNAVIGRTVELVEKFKQRGGNVIFVRCPSQDKFRFAENMGFPRESYWNQLIQAVDCPSYHFEDYEFMSRYKLPEWSHLASPDAAQFTLDLVRQMKQDGAL